MSKTCFKIHKIIQNATGQLLGNTVTTYPFGIRRNCADDVSAINMSYISHESQQMDKSPIVVMHGVLGSKENWLGLGRIMAEVTGRRVYAVDARNHGQSPHTIEHSSRHMAADVVALMRALSLPKICAMGHSMGGLCMITLALRYPELVERAIFLDISPVHVRAGKQDLREVFDTMSRVTVPKEFTLGQGRMHARHALAKEMFKRTAIELILKNLKKHPVTGEFYWSVNVTTLRDNWQDTVDFKSTLSGLQPYNGPVLFIAGRRSNYFQAEDMPGIRSAYFPYAELRWLNTGHLVHYGDSRGFLELVKEFLL